MKKQEKVEVNEFWRNYMIEWRRKRLAWAKRIDRRLKRKRA